jgi:hypothetical protein
MSQEWCRGEGTQSTQNRCKIWVQLGCNNTSRELLWALKQAIGAVDFQSVTSETSAVTAEAAGSSPVVPAIPFNGLQACDWDYSRHRTRECYRRGARMIVLSGLHVEKRFSTRSAQRLAWHSRSASA